MYRLKNVGTKEKSSDYYKYDTLTTLIMYRKIFSIAIVDNINQKLIFI